MLFLRTKLEKYETHKSRICLLQINHQTIVPLNCRLVSLMMTNSRSLVSIGVDICCVRFESKESVISISEVELNFDQQVIRIAHFRDIIKSSQFFLSKNGAGISQPVVSTGGCGAHNP